ncbi:HPr kinase/phosphorylase [Aedoeadaptatus ivorii]|uniref:HPr kinase/phosphorylase n=1 Tax=Aedoeadaptatus ivorii TaxID=54006 RepID=A0A3S4YKM5_9FIRM|nr:HPr(Ser) kinase/phosphatase [Peptoniphilus ivorii]MDQ0507681.1 HPr kinase/phosphorylase [Peptoniphilus ivorii]VEJ35399.1 HPr kinase/phosphorylase [Peptoniphilus ivorii]
MTEEYRTSFTVEQLIQSNDFEVVHKAVNVDRVRLYTPEFNRPGLQLCGFYTKFVSDRIQIIGGAEWHYLKALDPEVRRSRLKTLFEHEIPVLIVTRGQEIFPEMLQFAGEHDCTILRTVDPTSRAVNNLINFMDAALAPTIRKHGILLDIYGVGVLIVGDSGIGKSETALDLIVNGHKLIADDSVRIRKLENRLIGTSPKVTRHFMEIRGIGIIDVERLFGIGCIMEEKEIELVIHLTQWDDFADYNRLGIEDERVSILDISLPKVEIPMRTGRNTAVIIEIATRNFKQKEMGYNAALALNQRVLESIEENKRNR